MKPLIALAALCLLAWTPLPRSLSKPVPVPGGPPAEGFGRTARAASDGRGFFVTSHGSEFTDDSYGVALGEAGQLLGEESSFTGYVRGTSAVASSGRNYLVVWFDRAGFSARRVTTDGRAIDLAPIDVYRLPAALVNTFTPEVSVVWDGTRYVAVIETSDGHFRARFIGEDGVVSSEEVDVIGSGLAVIPGTVLVITRRTGETTPLEVQTLTAAGAGDPIVIGNGALAVGAGGDGEFLVVYLLDTDLRARRLDGSGHPIGAPLELESRGVIGNEFDVAWVRDHWLVVFVPNTDTVKGVRVRQEVIDETPFTIAENAVSPAVASNGSRALVTWRRKSGLVLEKAMVDGATVSPAGPLNRALMPVQGAFNSLPNQPRMAAIGATTLIAQALGDNVTITAVTGGVARPVATIPGVNNVLEVTGGGTHALVALTKSSGLFAPSVRFRSSTNRAPSSAMTRWASSRTSSARPGSRRTTSWRGRSTSKAAARSRGSSSPRGSPSTPTSAAGSCGRTASSGGRWSRRWASRRSWRGRRSSAGSPARCCIPTFRRAGRSHGPWKHAGTTTSRTS